MVHEGLPNEAAPGPARIIVFIYQYFVRCDKNNPSTGIWHLTCSNGGYFNHVPYSALMCMTLVMLKEWARQCT